MTTIEYKEKNEGNNFYNLGLIQNLKEILGSNSLLWLFPIVNSSETSGYIFNYDKDLYRRSMKNRLNIKAKENLSLSKMKTEENILCLKNSDSSSPQSSKK